MEKEKDDKRRSCMSVRPVGILCSHIVSVLVLKTPCLVDTLDTQLLKLRLQVTVVVPRVLSRLPLRSSAS
jgi:hypothetical protein